VNQARIGGKPAPGRRESLLAGEKTGDGGATATKRVGKDGSALKERQRAWPERAEEKKDLVREEISGEKTTWPLRKGSEGEEGRKGVHVSNSEKNKKGHPTTTKKFAGKEI